jgi:hypothetical protein
MQILRKSGYEVFDGIVFAVAFSIATVFMVWMCQPFGLLLQSNRWLTLVNTTGKKCASPLGLEREKNVTHVPHPNFHLRLLS